VLLLISFFLTIFYFLSVCFCTLLLISVSIFPFARTIVFKYSLISSTYSFLCPSHSMLNLFCITFVLRIVLFFLVLFSVPFSLQALAHSITAHCSSVLLFAPITTSSAHTNISMYTGRMFQYPIRIFPVLLLHCFRILSLNMINKNGLRSKVPIKSLICTEEVTVKK
jgi:hypothetical protein